MAIKDWYKLTFLIESDSEEIIIWKLNELGIFSFSFEYLIKNENKKEVNIWLPINEWDDSSKSKFEKIICKLLEINESIDQFFEWSVIKEEDWLTSWKKYWAPELVGNNFLILPCWINLSEKYSDKQIIKIDPGAAFGTGSHPSTSIIVSSNLFGIGSSILSTITASPLTILRPTCIEAIFTLLLPNKEPSLPIIPGMSLCLVSNIYLLGDTLTGY